MQKRIIYRGKWLGIQNINRMFKRYNLRGEHERTVLEPYTVEMTVFGEEKDINELFAETYWEPYHFKVHT